LTLISDGTTLITTSSHTFCILRHVSKGNFKFVKFLGVVITAQWK